MAARLTLASLQSGGVLTWGGAPPPAAAAAVPQRATYLGAAGVTPLRPAPQRRLHRCFARRPAREADADAADVEFLFGEAGEGGAEEGAEEALPGAGPRGRGGRRGAPFQPPHKRIAARTAALRRSIELVSGRKGGRGGGRATAGDDRLACNLNLPPPR